MRTTIRPDRSRPRLNTGPFGHGRPWKRPRLPRAERPTIADVEPRRRPTVLAPDAEPRDATSIVYALCHDAFVLGWDHGHTLHAPLYQALCELMADLVVALRTVSTGPAQAAETPEVREAHDAALYDRAMARLAVLRARGQHAYPWADCLTDPLAPDHALRTARPRAALHALLSRAMDVARYRLKIWGFPFVCSLTREDARLADVMDALHHAPGMLDHLLTARDQSRLPNADRSLRGLPGLSDTLTAESILASIYYHVSHPLASLAGDVPTSAGGAAWMRQRYSAWGLDTERLDLWLAAGETLRCAAVAVPAACTPGASREDRL